MQRKQANSVENTKEKQANRLDKYLNEQHKALAQRWNLLLLLPTLCLKLDEI
jgi:hypothetical protein